MATKSGATDDTHVLVLPPILRGWWSAGRAFHGSKVRILGESQWIAEGTEIAIAVHVSDGKAFLGAAVKELKGKIQKNRLVSDDGSNGVEHELDWTLPDGAGTALGAQFVLKAPDPYGVSATSPLLEIDLAPFEISE